MQAKNNGEHRLVMKCMAALCKKAGFFESQILVQRDLEFLCESIEAKTGVLISLSTIKRLLNGQFSRLPQIATLNAISVYLGYEHWQDYKSQNLESVVEPIEISQVRSDPPRAIQQQIPRKPFSPKSIFFICLFVVVLFVSPGAYKIYHNIYKTPKNNFENVQFSAQKTTANDLPNTVIFKYNVDDIKADSFFLQQSWDEKRRIRIFKKNYTVTDIYLEPGYHTAKLIANNQIIKTVDVSIPTDKWFFYAKSKSKEGPPKYIATLKEKKNQHLYLDRADLLSSQIDIMADQEYIQVYFPSEIKYSSDNYVLKFRIKVDKLTNTFCPYFMCEVFCQRNFMFFTSTLLGCTSEIRTLFGENYLSGKTHDFSAMGCNVNEWQNVELTVMNKKVSIFINSEEVFSNDYTNSSGLITGIGFMSNGLVEVELLNFETLKGEDILRAAADSIKTARN